MIANFFQSLSNRAKAVGLAVADLNPALGEFGRQLVATQDVTESVEWQVNEWMQQRIIELGSNSASPNFILAWAP